MVTQTAPRAKISEKDSAITTRSSTVNATMRVVFDTTELLEAVLLFVAPREMFEVQRVSKRWNGVTQHSLGLQRKMTIQRPNAVRRSSLLATLVGGDPRQVYHQPTALYPLMRCEHGGQGTHVEGKAAAQPEVYGIISKTTIPAQGQWRAAYDVHIRYVINKAAMPLKNTFAIPSWQRVFVTQPPIRALELKTGKNATIAKKCISSCTVWNTKGLVWKDVMDAVFELTKHHEEAEVTIADFSMMVPMDEMANVLQTCDGLKDESGACRCVRFLTGQ